MSGTAKFAIGFIVLAILAWIAGATLSGKSYQINQNRAIYIPSVKR